MGVSCPRCDQPLDAEENHLQRCPRADGAFVTSKSVEKLLSVAALAAYQDAAERALPGRMACPGCRAEMGTLHVERHGDAIELDACPKCGGTWFDLGEIERLTALPARTARERASAAPAGGMALQGGVVAAQAFADPHVIGGIFALIAGFFDS